MSWRRAIVKGWKCLNWHSKQQLARRDDQVEGNRRGLLDHYIDRVERYNPSLNAIIVMDVERGRERARQADAALAKGEVWGPLHGVPMAIESIMLPGYKRRTVGRT